MSAAARPLASVDELFRLDPLGRFQALIAGPNFDDYLRAEPISFERTHPIYGNCCGVPHCPMHSTQAEWWCTQHADHRRDALRGGVGEAEWLAGAIPLAPRRKPSDGRRPACRFCPDLDAAARELCRRHEARLRHARRGPAFDEQEWAARQVAFAGVGDCRVEDCLRRSEAEPSLCPNHRIVWLPPGGPTARRWTTGWRGAAGARSPAS